MPMELRTGLPGTFKTCGAVEQLIKYAEDEAYKDRPRYVLGVTNLRPDLAEVITESQFRDWKSLPVGSIVLVDEAQKVMPARRSGDAPLFIRDMSEHRHRGITFIFITQNPAMLDKYVRDLVDHHYHHVRKYGSMWAERWEFQHCESDPTRKGAKELALGKEFVKASSDAMDSYTSAEIHTIQRKIPRFLKVGIAIAIAIPCAFGFAYWKISSVSKGSTPKVESAAQPEKPTGGLPVPSKSGPSHDQPGAERDHVMTKDEWIARFEPRVPGMPWSAPAYDKLAVQGVPELYCVTMLHESGDKTCHCITEQGTAAIVPYNMCMQMARGGTYNPYRKPRPDQLERKRDNLVKASADDVAAETLPEVAKLHSERVGSAYVPPEQTSVSAVSESYRADRNTPVTVARSSLQ